MEKTQRLQGVYQLILLVILGGVVLHAPISVWLSIMWPEYGLVFKSWKEVLLAISAGLAVILVVKQGLWQTLWRDWVVRLITVYALLHVLLLFVLDSGGALPKLAGLMIDLRYILYFALVYAAVLINPKLRQPFLKVAYTGALIVVGFGLLQITILPDDFLKHLGYSADTIKPFISIDENPDYVRINSTMRGPNPLGAYMIIVLAVVVAASMKRKLNSTRGRVTAGFLVAAGALVLWASYSRSALIAATTALLFVSITTVGRSWSRRSWIVSFAVLGALIGGLLLLRDSDFVSNVIMHENPESSSVVKSNDEHFSSLAEGFSRMVSQPFGAGIGSTGSASLYGGQPLIIENQYLFVAHEAGWLGLGLFIAIFGLILWRLWQARSDYLALGVLASGIGLALVGLLLPVWADDTVGLIWWGLAGLVLGGLNIKKGDKRGRSLEQKTT